MYVTIKTLNSSFTTDPERWLGHSRYFQSLLSGQWETPKDGSYFIETEGDVFKHILQYLRTNILPIFYTTADGHDFALYQALLGEAEYFGIDRLCQWLKDGKYLEAVTVKHLVTETGPRPCAYEKFVSLDDGRTLRENPRFVEMITGGHVEVSMSPISRQQNYCYCPRGHHGKGTKYEFCNCVRDSKADIWKSEDVLQWCIIRREVKFNHNLCATAYLEET